MKIKNPKNVFGRPKIVGRVKINDNGNEENNGFVFYPSPTGRDATTGGGGIQQAVWSKCLDAWFKRISLSVDFFGRDDDRTGHVRVSLNVIWSGIDRSFVLL